MRPIQAATGFFMPRADAAQPVIQQLDHTIAAGRQTLWTMDRVARNWDSRLSMALEKSMLGTKISDALDAELAAVPSVHQAISREVTAAVDDYERTVAQVHANPAMAAQLDISDIDDMLDSVRLLRDPHSQVEPDVVFHRMITEQLPGIRRDVAAAADAIRASQPVDRSTAAIRIGGAAAITAGTAGAGVVAVDQFGR